MAMTLRLSDEDAALVRGLAEAEGVSQHEAILRAVRDKAEHLGHARRVDEATEAMLERWGDVLDRLGTV